MWKAIRRWLKIWSYRVTGRIDEANKLRMQDPYVVKAIFAQSIEEDTNNIHRHKQAIAMIISQQEDRMARVKSLTEQVKRFENLKVGAAAITKKIVAKLQKEGKTTEEIEQDAEYQKYKAAFRDASSTLKEKQDKIDEYEKEVEDYQKVIDEHKIGLQNLIRELDKKKVEAADTEADVIIAKQRKEAAEILAGIAKNETSKEIQQVREMRRQLKAEARITEELAGTDVRKFENDLIKYAQETVSDDEFAQLVGLKKEEEAPVAVTPEEEPVEKDAGEIKK